MTQVFKGKKMSYRLPWGGEPVKDVRMYIYTYGEGGRMAIQLTASNPEMPGIQEPFMTCTVNLPDEECPSNEVYIKDWAENAGCAEWLIEQGVLERKPSGHVSSGWITAARYRLTVAFLHEAAFALTDGKRVLKKSQRGSGVWLFLTELLLIASILCTALAIDSHLNRIEAKLNLMTCYTDSECESACNEAGKDDCEERYNPK